MAFELFPHVPPALAVSSRSAFPRDDNDNRGYARINSILHDKWLRAVYAPFFMTQRASDPLSVFAQKRVKATATLHTSVCLMTRRNRLGTLVLPRGRSIPSAACKLGITTV